MRIDKAIEILVSYLGGDLPDNAEDEPAAIRLGIEALKRCQHNYLNPQRADFRRLPGETDV